MMSASVRRTRFVCEVIRLYIIIFNNVMLTSVVPSRRRAQRRGVE